MPLLTLKPIVLGGGAKPAPRPGIKLPAGAKPMPVPTVPPHPAIELGTVNVKFMLHAFAIKHRRTNHPFPVGGGTDTVKIATSLRINDGPRVDNFHNVGDVGDLDTWFGMNIGFEGVPVKVTDKIHFAFTMVNAGHGDDALTKKLLSAANDALSKLGSASAASGTAWGLAGAGGAELAKILVNELGALYTADCDGPLAGKAFTLSGVDYFQKSWVQMGDYPALDNTPTGCGGNPHYQVCCTAEVQRDHVDRLTTNSYLSRDQQLTSKNGDFVLRLQKDGNLVVYDQRLNIALWQSYTDGTAVTKCIMQDDGNLVLYDDAGHYYWNSRDVSHYPAIADAYAIMQDDGNLVVYSPGGVNALFNASSNIF